MEIGEKIQTVGTSLERGPPQRRRCRRKGELKFLFKVLKKKEYVLSCKKFAV